MWRGKKILTLVAAIGIASGAAGAGDLSVKWPQWPDLVAFTGDGVPLLNGWDEVSMVPRPVAADDFLCKTTQHITDLHWWGSFPGYDGSQAVKPVRPDGFLIRFWADVPAYGDPDPDISWSRPGEELHRIVCADYRMEPFGYDIDVWEYQQNGELVIEDQCFQFNQKFDPCDRFLQEGTKDAPRTYWVSIEALYDAGSDLPYPWGWKTRPHVWGDLAVHTDPAMKYDWVPLEGPGDRGWDLAFELTVPEPATVALLAAGSALALVRRRRRKIRPA